MGDEPSCLFMLIEESTLVRVVPRWFFQRAAAPVSCRDEEVILVIIGVGGVAG